MNERGDAGLTVLLALAALVIGYLGAQVEMHREACPESHQAGCLFGGNDVMVDDLPALWMASGETGPVGDVVVPKHEVRVEGMR